MSWQRREGERCALRVAIRFDLPPRANRPGWFTVGTALVEEAARAAKVNPSVEGRLCGRPIGVVLMMQLECGPSESHLQCSGAPHDT